MEENARHLWMSKNRIFIHFFFLKAKGKLTGCWVGGNWFYWIRCVYFTWYKSNQKNNQKKNMHCKFSIFLAMFILALLAQFTQMMLVTGKFYQFLQEVLLEVLMMMVVYLIIFLELILIFLFVLELIYLIVMFSTNFTLNQTIVLFYME